MSILYCIGVKIMKESQLAIVVSVIQWSYGPMEL